MRNILTSIIQEVNTWIFEDTDSRLDIIRALNSVELPVWSEMSNEEKMTTLSYINENLNSEDFGHSELCTPECQAAAAFCVEFFKGEDLLGILFDDLDFMTVRN